MRTIYIYLGYTIYMFKGMFTGRERKDRTERNSDMTINEDTVVEF